MALLTKVVEETWRVLLTHHTVQWTEEFTFPNGLFISLANPAKRVQTFDGAFHGLRHVYVAARHLVDAILTPPSECVLTSRVRAPKGRARRIPTFRNHLSTGSGLELTLLWIDIS